MNKQWHMLQPDPLTVRQLSQQLKCHPVTAAVLANRNICNPRDANRFLNASLKDLRLPSDLIGMEAAVKLDMELWRH